MPEFMRNSTIVLLAAIFLFGVASVSHAQDDVALDASSDARWRAGDVSQELQWLPNERWDTVTGNVSHYSVDVDLPGQGNLPVRLAHIVRNTGRASFSFDIPRLTFASYKSGDRWTEHDSNDNDYSISKRGQRVCDGLQLARNFDLTNVVDNDNNRILESGTRILRSGIQFHFAEQTVHFFPNRDDEFIDRANTRRFPANADYVSPDNWFITCSDSSFKVHAPNGWKYTLDKWIHPGSDNTSTATIYATSIHDPHNNWVEYEYKPKDYPSSGRTIAHAPSEFADLDLLAIRANDGREINLRYDRKYTYVTSTGNPRPVNITYFRARTSYIVQREDGAKTSYWFSSFRLAGVSSTLVKKLQRIKYPEGGEVTYSYRSRAKRSYIDGYVPANTYSLELESRRTSDGAVYNFDLKDVPVQTGLPQFARLVKTPSTLLEYRLAKSLRFERKPFRAKENQPSHGRVVSFRNHGNIEISDWSASRLPLYQRDTQWKRLNSVVRLDAALDEQEARALAYQVPNMQNQDRWQLYEPWLAYFDAYAVVPSQQITSYPRAPSGAIQWRTETTVWDEFNRPVRITQTSNDGQSRVIVNGYWANTSQDTWINGLLKTRTNSAPNHQPDIRSNTYNAEGLLETTNVNGITNSYSYNVYGELEEHTNAQGHTHYTRNYYRGISREDENRRKDVLIREVNSDGTLKSETQWGGQYTTRYEYDDMRRIKKVITPGNSSDIVTDWLSPTHRRVTQGDLREETRFDTFGRVVFSTSFDSRATSRRSSIMTRYDNEGRVVFESNPNALDWQTNLNQIASIEGTHYRYDALGRVTRTHLTTPNKGVVNYVYNDDGYSVRTIDGRGVTKTYVMRSYGQDGQGQPIRIHHSRSPHAVFMKDAVFIERDHLGKPLTSVRDGLRRTWTYDTRHRLKSVKHPEHGLVEYTYFDDGPVKTLSKQDAYTTYEYTPNNQLAVVTTVVGDASTTRTYGYNPRGLLDNLETQSSGYATDQQSELAYDYDADSNLTEEKLTVDYKTLVLNYEYDSLGNVDKIEYPTGRSYDLPNDALGRPLSIREQGLGGKTIFSALSHYPNGMMWKANAAKVNMLQTVERYGFPKSIIARGGDLNSIRAQRNYIYDSALNVDRIENLVAQDTLDLDYDNRNRLKYANSNAIGSWVFTYDYRDNIDAVNHNGVTRRYYYNRAANRLNRIEAPTGIKRFQYDSRGNITNNGQTNIQYMANDRTLKVGGNSYVYDGHGRRVLTKVSDGNKVYQFYDASGTLRYRYDAGSETESEYHYVAGKLLARRDSSGSDSDDGNGGSSTNYQEIFRDDFNGSAVSSNFYVPSWAISGRATVNNRNACSQSNGVLSLTIQNVGGESQACYLISNMGDIGPGEDSTIKVDFHANVSSVKAKGAWFAGWIYPTGLNPDGSHPAEDNNPRTGTEFDVFEYMPTWDSAYNTSMHDGAAEQDWIYGDRLHGINLTQDEFHTFSMEWNKECVVFSIDGMPTRASRSPLISSAKRHALHITMEAQTGVQWTQWDVGNFAQNLNSNPAVGKIDWVSVSKKVSIDPALCDGAPTGDTTTDDSTNDPEPNDLTEPTVSGNILSWPSTGWWQVQTTTDYSEVCTSSTHGTSCELPNGTYQVINHTTGDKYREVVVPNNTGTDSTDDSDNDNSEVTEPTVAGNVLSWPSTGWWQVQTTTDYSEVCTSSTHGTSCTLPDGTYQIINHTTGDKYREVVVPNNTSTDPTVVSNNDNSEPTEPTVAGNVLSWPSSGWWQVQTTTDYSEVCTSSTHGTSCTLPSGIYQVINHTTGQKFPEVVVR